MNFVNWDRDSAFSHFSRLVSLDFLRFLMEITIAREVTGNKFTSLPRYNNLLQVDLVILANQKRCYMTSLTDCLPGGTSAIKSEEETINSSVWEISA